MTDTDSLRTSHTPAPWVVRPSDDDTIAFINGPNWSEFATVVVGIKGERGYNEEGTANARLIAAAPDLLEACKAAEEWLAGWASAEPYIGVIQAAIAKAEGLDAERGTGASESEPAA